MSIISVKRVDGNSAPPQEYIETIIRAMDGYVTHFRLPDISGGGRRRKNGPAIAAK